MTNPYDVSRLFVKAYINYSSLLIYSYTVYPILCSKLFKIELESNETRKYTQILYLYNICEVLYIIEYKSYLTI